MTPVASDRPVRRRALLGWGLAAAAAGSVLPFAACSPRQATDPMDTPGERNESAARRSGKPLLVYFSRAGENYYYGTGSTSRSATPLSSPG